MQGTGNSHPSDEDLSLHPIEQKSLSGDPESLGTPAREQGTGKARSGGDRSDEGWTHGHSALPDRNYLQNGLGRSCAPGEA